LFSGGPDGGWPTFLTDGIGVVIVALVWYMQKRKNKLDNS